MSDGRTRRTVLAGRIPAGLTGLRSITTVIERNPGPRMPGADRMESGAIDCYSGAFSSNSASPLAAWRCTLPIVVLRPGKHPGRARTRVRSTPASGAPRFRLRVGEGIATGHRCVHPETQTPRKGSRVRCWTAVGNRFPDPVAGPAAAVRAIISQLPGILLRGTSDRDGQLNQLGNCHAAAKTLFQ